MNKLLAATLVVSPLILSSVVSAAPADGTTAATKDSDAIVKFKVDESKEKPKDPNEPGKEVTPKDPEDPSKDLDPDGGTPGPLSIDFASKFYFGENLVSLKDENYFAKPQAIVKDGKAIQVPNYVQVTDKRGTLSGWHLTVKQNGQFKSLNVKTGTELTGAVISFMNGNLSTISTSKVPSGIKASFDLDPNGAEQTVVNAKDGEGAGQWLYHFGHGDMNGATDKETIGDGDKSVNLFVPASANTLADTYKTTLTWTLKDVPDADFK